MEYFLLNTDNRLKYLHNLLVSKNKISYLTNFDNLINQTTKNNIAILPPNFKWTTELASRLPKNITLICGNASLEVQQIFKLKDIAYFNLMQNETFVLKNALLTAEGFLSDFIINTPSSIFEQKILILGGGRVAKAVALILNKLGINFDITMRNNLKLTNFQFLTKNIINWKNFKSKLKNYDVVINTIPFEIFNQKDLSKFKAESVFFELSSIQVLNFENTTKNLSQTKNSLINNLASNIDGNTKKGKKTKKTSLSTPKTALTNSLTPLSAPMKYVFCPGLPGKYTPKSAGKLIYEYLKSNSFLK